MKNYPHLYTPVNNKKSSFSNQIKSHKKSTSIINNSTQNSKIPSNRTLNPVQNSINRRGTKNPRISSRSIQQMHFDRSQQDNYQIIQRKNMLFQQIRPGQYYPMPSFGQYRATHDQISHQPNQQLQLFQKSYQKIGQIKYQMHNKTIDHELNQVLQLIKEQKLRANETVKTLKKTADHYKKICQSVTKMYTDKQTNTEELIPYLKEIQTKDNCTQYVSENNNKQSVIMNRNSSPSFAKVQIETPIKGTNEQRSDENNQAKKEDKKQDKIDGKQLQIYKKLATMLEDMNINSKNILPEDIQLNFQVKDYKNLSQGEIIKIQKFFIKKLVEKIPK